MGGRIRDGVVVVVGSRLHGDSLCMLRRGTRDSGRDRVAWVRRGGSRGMVGAGMISMRYKRSSFSIGQMASPLGREYLVYDGTKWSCIATPIRIQATSTIIQMSDQLTPRTQQLILALYAGGISDGAVVVLVAPAPIFDRGCSLSPPPILPKPVLCPRSSALCPLPSPP